MSEANKTTKKRGRPPSGKAKSAAQRMATSRLRALEALNASSEPDLSGVSIAGLLECCRVAMRDGSPWQMTDPVAELFRRANERTRHKVAVSFCGIEPEHTATVAENSEAQAEPIPVTVADNNATDSTDKTATVAENGEVQAEQVIETVAENKPNDSANNAATVAKKKLGYPVEIKRMAVEMFDAGADTREIRQAILDQLGRAPRMDNIKRQIDEQWRKALAKAEAAS
ncbi:hypothetical protein Thiowin_00475 [Thiorhodovibrio winogradskyi]|uniref:Uncharacterized protein n=1 Tax=Thiorhodovibrio winogradskyi TaxID=77007 RepID=A0ABZ0S4S6_9GAMM|nr:hypothetical protein [Thiorhodovibrio winogradskyi]